MTVSKFQYMPGGQGGGWARPTAGDARSISGKIANATAHTALLCRQGFIGHLPSVAFCVESLRFMRCPGARFSADGGDHSHGGVHDLHAGSGVLPICCFLRNGQIHRAVTVAGRPGWRGRVGRRGVHWIPPKPNAVPLAQWSYLLGVHLNGLTSIPGVRDFCVVTCEGFGPTLQRRICRALWSVYLSCAHTVQGALPRR